VLAHSAFSISGPKAFLQPSPENQAADGFGSSTVRHVVGLFWYKENEEISQNIDSHIFDRCLHHHPITFFSGFI